MCKHGNVFSRPVLIGRGLGLDTQLRENKQLQTRRIVHRYGVLRGRPPRAPVASNIVRSAQERALLIRAGRNIFLVVMAAGIHPFPFRTRKLSLPAPMVLGGRPPGRVGRRQNLSVNTPRLFRSPRDPAAVVGCFSCCAGNSLPKSRLLFDAP